MGLVGIFTYMTGCFINGKIYGKLVGKYTSPMDAGWDMVLMKFLVNHFLVQFFISEIISANNDGDQGIHQWEWCLDLIFYLVGGFSPTPLKNMLVKLDHLPR